MDMPEIRPLQWLTIGSSLSAVVCLVYSDKSLAIAEVVYLDGIKAINEDIIWTGNRWEFAINGPNGGYADKNQRLAHYVAKLRAGRKPEDW